MDYDSDFDSDSDSDSDEDEERVTMNEDVPITSDSPTGEPEADITETSAAEVSFCNGGDGSKLRHHYLYLGTGPMSGQVKFGYSQEPKLSHTTR